MSARPVRPDEKAPATGMQPLRFENAAANLCACENDGPAYSAEGQAAGTGSENCRPSFWGPFRVHPRPVLLSFR